MTCSRVRAVRRGVAKFSRARWRIAGSWFQVAMRTTAFVGAFLILLSGFQTLAIGQTVPSARQIGTVKEVSPNTLTISTDAGSKIVVNVADGARVLQLVPGNTDLKTAQTIALRDIEVGDRVLVTGHQDAADAMTVSRVILMKSTDIAQKHEAEEADWQKRGTGGLVSAVDAASGSITVDGRSGKVTIETQPATIYRRYANGSVKFADAVPGTLGQIQHGDQLRVRGAKSGDGLSVKAEEIVSGSFLNLAGTIVAVDAAADSFTLKDMSSKKTMSVKLTANSSIRTLPAEDAARFAARAKGGASSAPSNGAKLPPAAGVAVGDPHADKNKNSGSGAAGIDLSQLIGKLPQGSLGDLHAGEALMIVAEKTEASSDKLTAITVLSGVDPILAATPDGAASMTLSPWNVSGGPDGGGI